MILLPPFRYTACPRLFLLIAIAVRRVTRLGTTAQVRQPLQETKNGLHQPWPPAPIPKASKDASTLDRKPLTPMRKWIEVNRRERNTAMATRPAAMHPSA